MNVAFGYLVVQQALAELNAGAAEQGGNNCGPFVEKYLNAEHPQQVTHRGEAWCCAFFCWCVLQAAAVAKRSSPVAYTRSCSCLWSHFEARGAALVHRSPQPATFPRFSDTELALALQPGDAVFWDHDANGTPDHVNMVVEVRAGELLTLGGNEGSANIGAPVRIRNHGPLSELQGLFGFGLLRAGFYPQQAPTL